MFYPYVSKESKKEVQKTLNSRFIGQGDRCDQFEKEFAKKLSTKYAVSLNSGTAALNIAYHLADIKPGDEVITTVLTCTATNIPLLHMGAKIVFADVGNDLNIDPKDVRSKITNKTKAIVNTHLYGNPSNIGEMPVTVIGDSSQYHRKPLACDDYVCYSLQAIKHITTGDGGMLVVRNKEDNKRARDLRWFGIDRDKKKKAGWQPFINREMTTDIVEPGWKYQMTDIDAAMGLGNIREYDKIMGHHERLKKIYTKELTDVAGIAVIGGTWAFPILAYERERLSKMLLDHNIESNVVQIRNDIITAFGGKRQDLPNMNRIEDKYLALPLHMKVSEKDVMRICKLIKKGW